MSERGLQLYVLHGGERQGNLSPSLLGLQERRGAGMQGSVSVWACFHSRSSLPRTQAIAASSALQTQPQRKANSFPLHSLFLAAHLLHPSPQAAVGRPTTRTQLALMTTAPNIEMIASSLRHCSINGGRRRAGARRGDDSESVTVELNSDVALPYHWEQCLDIRTGQVYYINWEDGTRTAVDPRTSAFTSSPTPRSTSSASRRVSTPSSGYTSVSSVGAEEVAAGDVDSGYDNDNEEEDEDADDEEEEDDEEESSSSTASSSSSSSRGSAVSSTLSSFSPTDESASGDNGSVIGTGDNNSAGHVLVAAGCRACFMYFMVPKRADVCPKCGSSGLLHLSRNGYA